MAEKIMTDKEIMMSIHREMRKTDDILLSKMHKTQKLIQKIGKIFLYEGILFICTMILFILVGLSSSDYYDYESLTTAVSAVFAVLIAWVVILGYIGLFIWKIVLGVQLYKIMQKEEI